MVKVWDFKVKTIVVNHPIELARQVWIRWQSLCVDGLDLKLEWRGI